MISRYSALVSTISRLNVCHFHQFLRLTIIQAFVISSRYFCLHLGCFLGLSQANRLAQCLKKFKFWGSAVEDMYFKIRILKNTRLCRNTDFTYLLTFSSSMKIHTRKSSSGVCIFLYHPHMYQFLRQMTDTIMLIDK